MICPASLKQVIFFSFLGTIIALRGRFANSFTKNLPIQQPSYWKPSARIRKSPASCQMVRNIDMVEALIFYGTNSIYENKGERIFLPGVADLIEECMRDETSVIAILDKDQDKIDNENIYFRTETSPAPNPYDLWEAIHSIEIQPKGFGGSSGFGRKAADPERSPLPRHCVVLCDTVEKCRAARFAGMRVLCLTNNELGKKWMDGLRCFLCCTKQIRTVICFQRSKTFFVKSTKVFRLLLVKYVANLLKYI